MKPSIQRKLALWSGFSCAALVGLVSIAAWWRMNSVLRDELDRSLALQAALLGKLLEIDNGRVRFDPDMDPHRNNGLGSDDFVHVRRIDGETIYQSPALQRTDAFDAILPSSGEEGPHWSTFAPIASRVYRVVVISLLISPDPDDQDMPEEASEQRVWMCVARPLAPLQQTLGQLRWALLSASLLALLATMLIGRHVARAGVHPIAAVAAAVDRAQPGQTQLALAANEIPIELEPVVGKTNALLSRIQEELARQRQLTADVAHDLRTPVAGVRTLLDVCRERPRSESAYVQTLDAARAALRQLTALLDDLLTLSRLDAAAERTLREPVAFEDAMQSAIEAVRPLAVSRGVAIDATPAREITLQSDRAKIVKILVNLLSNAVEHSPPNGSVQISVMRNNGTLEIRVQDQGPGVPIAIRERIFDRFVRADEARKSDGHHGLGLAIARALARLLGGDVRLEESTQRGSRFVATVALC